MTEARATREARDLDTHDLTQIVGDALRSHFGERRFAVKQIAAIANTNERTARNWYEKKNLPDLVHFFRLAAHVPELQAEARRLLALEAALDPLFARDLAQLVSSYQRRVASDVIR